MNIYMNIIRYFNYVDYICTRDYARAYCTTAYIRGQRCVCVRSH